MDPNGTLEMLRPRQGPVQTRANSGTWLKQLLFRQAIHRRNLGRIGIGDQCQIYGTKVLVASWPS